MLKLSPIICVSILAVGLSGCCRDSFRDMARYALRPDAEPVKKAERRSGERRAKSVAASASEIETGSVKEQGPGPDCQGEHPAYQATREVPDARRPEASGRSRRARPLRCGMPRLPRTRAPPKRRPSLHLRKQKRGRLR